MYIGISMPNKFILKFRTYIRLAERIPETYFLPKSSSCLLPYQCYLNFIRLVDCIRETYFLPNTNFSIKIKLHESIGKSALISLSPETLINCLIQTTLDFTTHRISLETVDLALLTSL